MATAQVYDKQQALETVGGSEEILHDAAEMLATEGPERMDAILAAITRRDADTLHRHAHSFKGTLGIFAASSAVERAEALLEAARQHEFAAAREAAVALDTELKQLIEALRRDLQL